ncbi:IclR family transcriptional regulator [Streptomyces iconiensis]|uniref:IclR family transcriptional regulator n=1 Tax=Streptomyces iconiensis TaxID=1384038 RepID=A0ABT7A338_9ACTN|nr:IclR family transcriptional regulator [Streptomyces iconiensis]MDJ1135730.1 IclR family transcriptional regulator [Streptomyces iconiensis]
MHVRAQADLECQETATPAFETSTPELHADSVLGKAHLLLGAFSSGSTCLGLTELSRRSGVPKTTVHRLGSELVRLGFLARTAEGYQLGWRIFELGQLVPGPARLRTVAQPALLDLRAVARAVIHLAVPQGTDCVYLERLAGRREAALLSSVGSRMPGLLTASGRLFLAHGEGEGAVLDACGAAPGPTDVAALRSEFDQIRNRHWAEERERCVPGFKTFAVPVMHPGGDRVIAAVSATVPMARRDEQRLIHVLWATAADIGRGLYRGAAVPRGRSGYRVKAAG